MPMTTAMYAAPVIEEEEDIRRRKIDEDYWRETVAMARRIDKTLPVPTPDPVVAITTIIVKTVNDLQAIPRTEDLRKAIMVLMLEWVKNEMIKA